jgi:serpin B
MKTFRLILAGLVIGLLVLSCDKKQEIEKVGEPQTATEQENPAQEDGQGEEPEQPAVNNNEEPEPSTPENSDENQTPEQGNDPEAGLPQYEFLANEAPSALSAAQKEQLSKLNTFAFSFAGLMDEKKGNNSFVFSPVSLAYLLGMISEGADGATRREICTSLGFGPDSQQEINEFCRDLMVLASKAASKDEVLQIANVAVLNKDFKLLESYRKSVKNYYDASAFNLDFATQDVAGYVNKWASEHTNGVIEKVLNDVDPATRAILMNALYFKAQWMIPFDEYYTAEGDFTGADGKVRKEMMMKSDPNDFKYAKLDGFSALRMEYGSSYVKAGNYCMYILLPDKGVSATQLLGKLDKSAWANMKSSLKSEYAYVKMPKFEVKLDENLNEMLSTLGINNMFLSSADFSRMSEEQLYVDYVKQVAKINVNETGTVAAAVSVAGMDGSTGLVPPKPVAFIADHPFLFAIEEKTTGTILFMGSYK